MKRFSSLICFTILLSVVNLGELSAQVTTIAPFFQMHISSPSEDRDNYYLPLDYDAENFTSSITFKSRPGLAIGATLMHTLNDQWSLYFVPSGELINLTFSNTISPLDPSQKIDPITIEHAYQLYYLSAEAFLGYAPKGYAKKSLIAKVGLGLHTLLHEAYNSTERLESPSKFNSTFATVQVELGTRFIMANKKPLELTFAVEADISGFEAPTVSASRPNPNPANLFTAGMRVHYFLFN